MSVPKIDLKSSFILFIHFGLFFWFWRLAPGTSAQGRSLAVSLSPSLPVALELEFVDVVVV